MPNRHRQQERVNGDKLHGTSQTVTLLAGLWDWLHTVSYKKRRLEKTREKPCGSKSRLPNTHEARPWKEMNFSVLLWCLVLHPSTFTFVSVLTKVCSQNAHEFLKGQPSYVNKAFLTDRDMTDREWRLRYVFQLILSYQICIRLFYIDIMT